MNWRTCGESMLPRPSLAPRSDCSRLFACWRSSAISEIRISRCWAREARTAIMAKARRAVSTKESLSATSRSVVCSPAARTKSAAACIAPVMHDRHEITDCGELCNMTKLVEGAIKRCDRAALVIVGNPFLDLNCPKLRRPFALRKEGPFTQYLITFLRNGGVMTGNLANKRCTLFFRSLLFPL